MRLLALPKKKTAFILFSSLALLLLFVCFPVSETTRHKAAVLLEQTSCYKVSAGQDSLYFSGTDPLAGLSNLSLKPDNCWQTAYEVGYFSSFRGTITTQKQAFQTSFADDSLSISGAAVLKKAQTYLEGRLKVLQAQLTEMDYYVQTHLNQDDGFEEMLSLLDEKKQEKVRLDSIMLVLQHLQAQEKGLKWDTEKALKAYYPGSGEKFPCAAWKDGKTQLVAKTLPEHARWIYNPFFTWDNLVEQADSLSLDSVSTQDQTSYISVLRGKGFQYVGELAGNTPHGLGVCRYANGSIRQGNWLNGQLNGNATLIDTTNVHYTGTWAYNHLAGGTARYLDGSFYSGSFMEDSIFDGAGEMHYPDGSFYYGSWAENKREGFGMYAGSDGRVQCGIWKEDAYQGERLLYTADRVYGIDISRYQHLNRRRRACNISWKYLRITSLGTRSKKRISGQVSYPISFVYIKATQGTSIVSAYFKPDYKAARAQGIHVGAYHFFSSKPAAQQLKWFLSHVIYQKGDLPPVLDLEPTNAYIKSHWGSDARMFAQVLIWLKGVEARFHVKPLLYVNQKFIRQHLSHAPKELQDYDLWVARYGEFKPYSHMVYWQIAPDGKVSGIQSKAVDINVFNGSKERFEEYVNSF